MKRFILPLIVLLSIGCSSPAESTPDNAAERTVEEINAERGDPCECIDSKVSKVAGFIEEVKSDAYKTSDILNKAFATTMDGCLATIGHVEADLAWAQQLKDCESFDVIREAMIEVKNAVMSLKDIEQNEYVKDIEEGATEVLDKLQKSAH